MDSEQSQDRRFTSSMKGGETMPNKAESGHRRVLVNHYMSAESLLPWRTTEGVGVARTDVRDIVMIAGEDPYAWKGIEDKARPGVRGVGEHHKH